MLDCATQILTGKKSKAGAWSMPSSTVLHILRKTVLLLYFTDQGTLLSEEQPVH